MSIRHPWGNRTTLVAVILLCFAPATARPSEMRSQQALRDRQLAKLLRVTSIFVDPLNGADGHEQIRDMIIGALQRTGLFVITEDEEQADAFLRGSAEDLIYADYYLSREGLQVRGASSSSRREDGESDFGSASFGIGETGHTSRRERKHEATAAVRLVLRSGEVIWSTLQESSGGKYRGSSPDLAEKVAAALLHAYREAEQGQAAHSSLQQPSGRPAAAASRTAGTQ